MNQGSVRGVSEVDVERNLTKTAEELGEDREGILRVRVSGWANRVEEPDQIGFLACECDVPVAEVERFGRRND
jgi:hypothetical protein